MKARAKQRTFFNKQVEPNICVIDPISFSPDELDFLVTAGGDRHAEEAFWNQFAEADTLRLADPARLRPDRVDSRVTSRRSTTAATCSQADVLESGRAGRRRRPST